MKKQAVLTLLEEMKKWTKPGFNWEKGIDFEDGSRVYVSFTLDRLFLWYYPQAGFNGPTIHTVIKQQGQG